MKKFMKAIAFVTVMCMALSTVAFAAGNAELGDTDKVLDITVTGAGTDQVALVVVAADAELNDFSNPLYVDQKVATSGNAEFTAVLTNASVDAVDVYVGYATYANENAAPERIGNDVALTNLITEVTIAKVDTEIVQGTEDLEGAQQIGAGVAITFDVEAPAGVSATNMIWAIRYTEDGVEKVKYTDSFDVTKYGIGTTLTTGVQLGLAFLNGFNRLGEEIDPVTITDVDAIFMFTNNEVEFTNVDDVANEAE